MFFVDKLRTTYRREFFIIHWVPTLLIFLTFIAVTLWSWQEAKDRAKADRQESLSDNIEQMDSNLRQRVDKYEEVLRAGAGLFKSSEDVTREEWEDFAKLFDLENRYPGIHGIEYSQVIPASQLSSHQALIRSEGASAAKYEVFPPGERDYYTSIIYAEPSKDKIDLSVIGFDLYTDPVRRAAMDQALASQEPSLTLAFYPLADKAKENLSLAIFFPIMIDDNGPRDISNASGFIQVIFQTDALFSGLVEGEGHEGFSYQIFGGQDGQRLLYQTANSEAINGSANIEKQVREVSINGRSWTIEASTNELAGTPEIQNRPSDILLSGVVISVFMAAFVYVLLLSRTRALRFKEETEIQMAKDELLALASHQLRTPATGVKQYVGMLIEGYAGNLSPKQIDLLKRADESNERQLNTINEMLSVARADTGRLPIERTKTNLNGMIEDIISEQRRSIEQRHQKISVHLPKDTIYANVDPHYFRMAIENILNNASKYTPKKGAIDIRLKLLKNELELSVDDTGVGIPERHFPMLFKKFSRIPNELSDQVSGTGIGLYLAKYIVEAHGGKLTFSSDPGVGSSFKIHLPIK